MHRTPRTALVTAAAAATMLFAAGCTTLVTGLPAPSSEPPAGGAPGAPIRDENVAWMDRVCAALLPATQTLTQPPELTGVGSPQLVISGLSAYLERAGIAVDSALTGVAAAGPSPIQGGDRAVRKLTTTLTSFRDRAREAQTNLEAIDTVDPLKLESEVQQAIAPLESLTNLPNTGSALKASPALGEAMGQAPHCRTIEAQVGD